MKILSASSFKISGNIIPSGSRPPTPTSHSTILDTKIELKINSFNFAGVYQIKSINSDECLFIGSSSNISKRIHQHISGFINNNEASNIKLREHYKKYGISDFDFDILEEFTFDEDNGGLELFRREKYFIELYEPSYNIVAYNRRIKGNKRYTFDSLPTDSYVNDTILNTFGNPIVNKFSIDRKTGHLKTRNINDIDERRKTWEPTYVVFDGDEPILTRGDNTNFKKKTPIKVVETVVVRKNPFGNGR